MNKETFIEEQKKQKEYEVKETAIKNTIKDQPKSIKRFFKLVWFYFKKPFKWILTNIKDWRTAVIFVIVFLVVSSEVWVPYLLAILSWGTPFSKTMIGVASVCWAFWLMPLTPFLGLCIGITAVVKAVFNKIRSRKFNKEK